MMKWVLKQAFRFDLIEKYNAFATVFIEYLILLRNDFWNHILKNLSLIIILLLDELIGCYWDGIMLSQIFLCSYRSGILYPKRHDQ